MNELKLIKRGKVRDIYELGSDELLIVATDRISAFDYVLPTQIPNKGKILNMLSCFFFELTHGIVDNHLITYKLGDYLPEPYVKNFYQRGMIVKRATPIKIECIVRGYITGSAWKKYLECGEISGIKLKKGLKESERFDEPIFTPFTKEEEGHDIEVDFDFIVNNYGKEVAQFLRDKSIELYNFAHDYLYSRGIILADTKFEFGFYDDNIILIDEIFTPDSSRFWRKELYEPGRPQESFDKQFVRDYLKSNWDKKSPPPPLPKEIVESTFNRYLEIYKSIVPQKNDYIIKIESE